MRYTRTAGGSRESYNAYNRAVRCQTYPPNHPSVCTICIHAGQNSLTSKSYLPLDSLALTPHITENLYHEKGTPAIWTIQLDPYL